jgi:hypothetical protein
MTPATLELARRTATTAVPFAEGLARDYGDVARTLRMGEVEHALAAFDASTDRLQRFLTFLVVATEMMVDSAPTVGAIMADYSRRLFANLDDVEMALGSRDVVALAQSLEHGLSRTLLEYTSYSSDVAFAFEPRPLAA